MFLSSSRVTTFTRRVTSFAAALGFSEIRQKCLNHLARDRLHFDIFVQLGNGFYGACLE